MMTAQYWLHQSGRKDTEMWNKQWERVDRFLKKWKLIERGDHILLGISGGADSVCLARYFLAKRESLALNLYAVHVNHMLRGDEAKRDEEFVREFCRQWNIPLHVEYRDIKKESREKKCSEEEAGRLARYECFTNYARQHQCSKIAVAHHQNDVAETILFRMIRGTGVQGMAGILPVNGEIIRPFLCLSREEIIDVLKELKQDGLVNGDDMVISHLEKELSGNSLLFPIGRNKDGSLSKTSHALPEELFRLVLSFAKRKEESVKDRMYDGEVSASPYEMGETTGCDYCPYRDICGFDPRLEGCSYRRLERYSSDDAVKKMREALEENVSRDASENEQSGKGREG